MDRILLSTVETVAKEYQSASNAIIHQFYKIIKIFIEYRFVIKVLKNRILIGVS